MRKSGKCYKCFDMENRNIHLYEQPSVIAVCLHVLGPLVLALIFYNPWIGIWCF